MKKIFTLLFFIVFVAVVGKYVMKEQEQIIKLQSSNMEVLIVHDGNQSSLGVRAFQSILEEEGVPFSFIKNQKLITMDPKKLSRTKPALLYPDGSDSYIDQDTAFWMKKYIQGGGHLLSVYDVGTKDIKGRYRLNGGVLDKLIGVRTIRYKERKEKAFIDGAISFETVETASYFGIPKGKIDANGTLVGYMYGQLNYPYADNCLLDRSLKVYLWGTRKDGTRIPLMVHKGLGDGSILYVNLPLAYLKGNSDDLWARSVLRTFLFKMVKIPHIVSAPYGRGGLVINWHIDSDIELIVQPWFLANGYYDHRLKYSIHITAGPDCDVPGDKQGFDADGKGKEIVKALLPYGIIGSHGGWAHNWFAQNVEDKKFSGEVIQTYINKNNQALEKITGYPITEYSAPDGIFPQPLSTHILKDLNMTSYYYPGDTGSAPNRTFYQEEMVSKDIIAFPVMTFNKYASLAELQRAHYSRKDTEELLKDLINYSIKNRTVRLFYSHPYDIYEGIYQDEVKSFLAYAIEKHEKGDLIVETMSYFRAFLLRLIATKKQFLWHKNTLRIQLENRNGFKEMVLALPKYYQGKRLTVKEKIDEDESYYYVPVDTNETNISLDFHYGG